MFQALTFYSPGESEKNKKKLSGLWAANKLI